MGTGNNAELDEAIEVGETTWKTGDPTGSREGTDTGREIGGRSRSLLQMASQKQCKPGSTVLLSRKQTETEDKLMGTDCKHRHIKAVNLAA